MTSATARRPSSVSRDRISRRLPGVVWRSARPAGHLTRAADPSERFSLTRPKNGQGPTSRPTGNTPAPRRPMTTRDVDQPTTNHRNDSHSQASVGRSRRRRGRCCRCGRRSSSGCAGGRHDCSAGASHRSSPRRCHDVQRPTGAGDVEDPYIVVGDAEHPPLGVVHAAIPAHRAPPPRLRPPPRAPERRHSDPPPRPASNPPSR